MTRKMQVFYTTMAMVTVLLLYSMFKGIVLTGDNLTNILMMVLIFAGAIAGANVGEHFADARKIKNGNGQPKA